MYAAIDQALARRADQVEEGNRASGAEDYRVALMEGRVVNVNAKEDTYDELPRAGDVAKSDGQSKRSKTSSSTVTKAKKRPPAYVRTSGTVACVVVIDMQVRAEMHVATVGDCWAGVREYSGSYVKVSADHEARPTCTGLSVMPRAAPADSKSIAVNRQWRTSGI